MDEPNAEKLRLVLDKYAVPDPKIVGKLPRGNIQLDYVGHAEITRILIEIDPLWDWKPLKIDDDGLPSYRVENGMAHMAGALTVLGHTRLAIGSAPHNKQDLLKELISDFLRNGAMRFGVALSLWSKEEWSDDSKPAPKPAPKKAPVKKPDTAVDASQLADPAIVGKFKAACDLAGISHKVVAAHAGVNIENISVEDMDKLRESFKALKEQQ